MKCPDCHKEITVADRVDGYSSVYRCSGCGLQVCGGNY